MPSLGSAALLEVPLLGAPATTTAIIMKAAAAAAAEAAVVAVVVAEGEGEGEGEAPVVLHPGLVTDVNATTTAMAVVTAIMAGKTTVTEALHLPVPRRGSNLLGRRLDTEAMPVVMLVATLVVLLWARLRVLVDHLELVVLEHLLHLLLTT